ncbi:hypothetical protein ABE459_12100 [Pseudomonas sp. TWI923]|uniref:hypothetical protein n=2 Tax=Pseudomonas TaxID=286 RepID=UPI00320955DA
MPNTLQHCLRHGLISLCALCLAGCTAAGQHTPRETPAQAETRFTRQMLDILQNDMLLANQQDLVGAVLLEVTLERDGRPSACRARLAPQKYTSRMPADAVWATEQALTALVIDQCRKSLFPIPPRTMRDHTGQLQVVAPIIFMPAEGSFAVREYLRQSAPRQAYAWQHLMAGETVTGTGNAFFWFEGDASGKVTRCLVELTPDRFAPSRFKPDNPLRRRLHARCMALDLRRMPGFALDSQGVNRGHVELEYAPWKLKASQ